MDGFGRPGEHVPKLTGEGGLLPDMIRQAVEAAFHAEMSGHLGYERHAPQGRGLGELPQQRSRHWARRCHADPDQLHGPYLTSTRKVDNKTVTRTPDSAQADARRTLLLGARRLPELTSELETLTLQQLRDDPAEPDP